MLLGIKLSGIAALGLLVSAPAAAFPGNFTRRTVTSNNLNDFRGALFVVASTQTSCEMALIDSSAGFIAASCLSFKSNGNVDNSIDYRIAITGIDGESTKIKSATMVDAHPKYNPSTHANNIAIIQWGNQDDIKWHQYFAQDRPDWDNVFYTRRTMSSVSDKNWNTPAVVSTAGSASPGGCAAASNLYNSNQDWFLCMAQTTTSMANQNCQTPYGAAWGVYQPNNIAIAALYSHSAIYGGDKLCGSTGNQYHYYTMLQPYTAWAAEMTGRKVYTYAADTGYSYRGSTSFGMSNSGASGVSGVNTVTGDMYPTAKSYKGAGGSASNSGETAGGNTPPPATSATPTNNNNGGGGATKPTNSSNPPVQTSAPGGNDNGGNDNGGNSNTGSGNTGGGNTNTGGGSSSTGNNNNGGNNSGGNNSSSGGGSNNGGDDGDNNGDNDGDNDNTNTNSGSGNSNSSGSNSSSKDSDKDSDKDNSNNEEEGGAAVTTNDKESHTDDSNSATGGDDDDDDDSNGSSRTSGGDKDGAMNDGSGDSSAGGSSGDKKTYGGLSRGALIAVATIVPIATIIIIIALFFTYRWWKRRQNARTWDPKNEIANIDRLRIMDELEGTSLAQNPRESTPPSYDDHGFLGVIDPIGKIDM
ncbi:hypothetical protein GGH12_001438 [Coemansia sp. RSA 1822]|nr:hypothetical protein LPJ76_001589 [Coemansia sp. RSA 638]KAJ2544410.1 hypothetical protein GGF49_001271 [Coemansia sp. RSA 1853]KAJ2565405.1 hypothetical protein GGH12_001438 [Coemansia sp. RSA 1822]